MRISFVSNAPGIGTGYGQQGGLLVPRLLADGHEVAALANFGLDGRIVELDGYRLYPRGSDNYGITSAPAQHRHFMHPMRPDQGWMLALYDAWPLAAWGQLFDEIPVAGWYPVDHIPVPPEVYEVAKRTRLVIAMSKYGQEQFKVAGIEARYVPHAVDTSVYRPDPEAAAGFRQRYGIPQDAYLVGTVAANNNSSGSLQRKGWGEMAFAMGRFMRDHPETFWYLHTDPFRPNGIRLDYLLMAAHVPTDRVRWVDGFAYQNGTIADTDVAAAMAAFDVHLLTSYGEGFGIPAIETQACGVPNILTDGTAQRELVGPGWKVAAEPLWDPAMAAWYHRPSVGRITEALEAAVADRGQARREAARSFAKEYDVDLVYDTRWRPVLRDMEAALSPAEDGPANRAERRRLEKEAKRAARRAGRGSSGPAAGAGAPLTAVGGGVVGVPPSAPPPTSVEP